MKFLKLTFIYKKDDILRYVKFLYTKIQTLRKKQDNLRYVFIYKNQDTFHYGIFRLIFEIGGGGGHFYMQRIIQFALNLKYKKRCSLLYVYIQKS